MGWIVYPKSEATFTTTKTHIFYFLFLFFIFFRVFIVFKVSTPLFDNPERKRKKKKKNPKIIAWAHIKNKGKPKN
jgi:hypothetical protein